MPFSILSSFQSIQIHRDSSQSFSIRLSEASRPRSSRYRDVQPFFPIHSTSFCVHSSLFPTISISLSFTFNFPFISLLSLFKGLQVFVVVYFSRHTKIFFFIVKVEAATTKTQQLWIVYIFLRCVCFLTKQVFYGVATTMMMRTSTGVFVPNVLPCFPNSFFPIHNFSTYLMSD